MKSIILLDRSGSMEERWSDVAGGIQSYIDGLAPDTKTWLVAFDTEYEEVWSGVTPGEIDVMARLAEKRVAPRGMTALYDAIGKLAKLVRQVGKKQVQVVILTDGMENSSMKVDRAAAGKIVETWKGRGYDVIFLGADWDAFAEAAGIGIDAGMVMRVNRKHFLKVGKFTAVRAARYRAGADAASLEWSEDEREQSVGEPAETPRRAKR